MKDPSGIDDANFPCDSFVKSSGGTQSYYNSVPSHLPWNTCFLQPQIHLKIDSTIRSTRSREEFHFLTGLKWLCCVPWPSRAFCHFFFSVMWLGGSFPHPFHLNMCYVSKSNKLSSHLVKTLVGSELRGTFQGTCGPSSTLISYSIDHLLSALTTCCLGSYVERDARRSS